MQLKLMLNQDNIIIIILHVNTQITIFFILHVIVLLQTSAIPLEVTMHPTMTSSNTIEITASGTTPLKYQWYSLTDNKKLTDGARFEGTETSRLVIKYTSSPSEGCYECRVEDKHNKSISSDSIGMPLLCMYSFKLNDMHEKNA